MLYCYQLIFLKTNLMTYPTISTFNCSPFLIQISEAELLKQSQLIKIRNLWSQTTGGFVKLSINEAFICLFVFQIWHFDFKIHVNLEYYTIVYPYYDKFHSTLQCISELKLDNPWWCFNYSCDFHWTSYKQP